MGEDAVTPMCTCPSCGRRTRGMSCCGSLRFGAASASTLGRYSLHFPSAAVFEVAAEEFCQACGRVTANVLVVHPWDATAYCAIVCAELCAAAHEVIRALDVVDFLKYRA